MKFTAIFHGFQGSLYRKFVTVGSVIVRSYCITYQLSNAFYMAWWVHLRGIYNQNSNNQIANLQATATQVPDATQLEARRPCTT